MQRQSFENVSEHSGASALQAPVADHDAPPPEIAIDAAMSVQATPWPYWAHRKIVHIDGRLVQDPGFFDNRWHVRLETLYNPRMTANDRFIRGYSTVPGHWKMRDFRSETWWDTHNSQLSAIVPIRNGGNHNDLFYGMYFCPDAGLEAFNASNPFWLWVQNYHMEGDAMLWEGGLHPNEGNHLQIDRCAFYPFPNLGTYWRF